MRLAPASLAVVVALALAACGQPALPTVPPGTVSPSVGGPSASATAVDPDYLEFRQRIQAAPDQLVRFVRDLALDAAPGPGTLRATAAAMRAWVAAERQAVSRFDPDGCFGGALQLYLEALLRSEEAATAYDEVGGLPSLPPEAPAAERALRAASDAMGAAEVAGNAALEDCR